MQPGSSRSAGRSSPTGRCVTANSSIGGWLRALLARGCDRILLVPLYPATCRRNHGDGLAMKHFAPCCGCAGAPTLRVAAPYYDDPIYRSDCAFARGGVRQAGVFPDVIPALFHGIRKHGFKGDPYHCQCAKTYRLLRERLQLDESRFMMTFQSRSGRAEWLQPYTDATVKRPPPKAGVKNPLR
ncbi:MAG: ferrochelatase [Xanthobacteraceae bacterium]